MASKEETLTRIRAALGRDGSTTAPEILPPFSSTISGPSDESGIERFCAELERVSGRVTRIGSVDEIKAYIANLLPDDAPIVAAVSDGATVREAGIREWLAGRGAAIVPTLGEFSSARTEEDKETSFMESYKRALIEASIGVTAADFAIADTGTLVLVSGGEQHRLISLVPPIHVCLLGQSRIVANLTELIAKVREEFYTKDLPPQAMTFITGPSRTADIELSLTLGVHGPRELHVLIYT